MIVADIEAAARWAQRLAAARPRRRGSTPAWTTPRARARGRALASGEARLGRGHALGAARTAGAAGSPLALVDEHEAAHKPPGPPRMHTRDVALERGRRERLRVLLTPATPSVEVWWRATERAGSRWRRRRPAPWPAVTVTDTRGILRREPLTPALSRAMRETLAAGRRVLLVVTRLASSLGCEDCGEIVRCAQWRSRSPTRGRPPTALLPAVRDHGARRRTSVRTAGGRRLSPFGWGLERVEHAVRRRFPKARVAR